MGSGTQPQSCLTSRLPGPRWAPYSGMWLGRNRKSTGQVSSWLGLALPALPSGVCGLEKSNLSVITWTSRFPEVSWKGDVLGSGVPRRAGLRAPWAPG